MGVAVFWHFFALMPGLSSHLPPPGAYSKRKLHLPKMLDQVFHFLSDCSQRLRYAILKTSAGKTKWEGA